MTSLEEGWTSTQSTLVGFLHQLKVVEGSFKKRKHFIQVLHVCFKLSSQNDETHTQIYDPKSFEVGLLLHLLQDSMSFKSFLANHFQTMIAPARRYGQEPIKIRQYVAYT